MKNTVNVRISKDELENIIAAHLAAKGFTSDAFTFGAIEELAPGLNKYYRANIEYVEVRCDPKNES